MSYLRGDIVDANIPDPDGNHCATWHPAMVVGANEKLAMLVIVGITGSFSRPLKPYWMELPWAAGGHPETGLNKECVPQGQLGLQLANGTGPSDGLLHPTRVS